MTSLAGKDAPRGTWVLVRAYDSPSGLKNNVSDKVADKAGYTIWKDRTVIIFYNNDLQSDLRTEWRRPLVVKCVTLSHRKVIGSIHSWFAIHEFSFGLHFHSQHLCLQRSKYRHSLVLKYQ